jgi:hypothetical protein
MDEKMKSYKIAARTFGIFFLLGYVSYALGFGLINSIINSPIGLSLIYSSKTLVIFEAAIMMAVFAVLNIGLAVIMTPLLKPFNKTITYGYLGTAITATVMLIVGAIFLLLLVPLSVEFMKAGTNDTVYFQTLKVLLIKGNFYSYQIAMAIWGLGGLMFCYLLYHSKLVPRPLSVWGFIGYIIFISGTILALFGYNVDVLLDIPGGLFEITLAIWLIVKGFNSPAIIYRSTKTDI